jgi:carbohydrate kinase (thermoresistant glucokinase family)
MIVCLMGISGSGKSTIGTLLSQKLGYHFVEGDDYHSLANKHKMSQGIPLNDTDRFKWLRNVSSSFDLGENSKGQVVACSALKKSYRSVLIDTGHPMTFIHLQGDFRLIKERLEQRTDHFFNPSLLDDQSKQLEPLGSDEKGFNVSIDQSIDLVVAEILASLND